MTMMVVVIDLDILEQVPLGVCQMGKDLTIQKLFPALSQQFPSGSQLLTTHTAIDAMTPARDPLKTEFLGDAHGAIALF